MEMMKLGKRKAAVVRIVSSISWVLDVHWLGRSMLCAGEDRRPCPGCGIERARRKLYAIAEVKTGEGWRETGLAEFGTDVLAQLMQHGFSADNPLGFAWKQTLHSDGRRWILPEVAIVETEACDPSLLPLSLETLYGLQLSLFENNDEFGASTKSEWLNFHRRQILGRISYHCQNGSHSVAADASHVTSATDDTCA